MIFLSPAEIPTTSIFLILTRIEASLPSDYARASANTVSKLGGQYTFLIPSEAMNKRRRAAPRKPASSAPLVHDFAAPSPTVVKKAVTRNAGGGLASKQTRSIPFSPARTKERLPAAPKAPVPKSERTTSLEEPVSERLPTAARVISRNLNQPPSKPTSDWNHCKHYAGFDWASRSHQVVIVDSHGHIVANFSFENSAAGWELWHQKVKAFAPLAVCVETNEGVLVERLLQTEGCVVYPINPQAGKAYCTRKAPSGVKTDFRNAWAFADALRVDGHG
jgi:hypothetical protein